MANEPGKGPSWKNPGGGGGSRPAQTSRKQWQPSGKAAENNKPVDPRVRFRKRLLAAGVTGSLLLAAVVVVVWLFRPPKRPALVMPAMDSSSTLSALPNVYGSNTVKALADWAGRGKNRAHLIAEGVGNSRDGWKAALTKASDKSIIIYFAAPGAADAAGPYLWMSPADAVSIADAQKLPVREILDSMKERPDLEKLVVFDATQIAASWAHGFLHNDFARALKTLDAEIQAVPNLTVICSSGDDQRSWVSDELRQSAFGYYFSSGIANGAGTAQQRLNALNLFDYVKKEVANWSRVNRDADQTPFLLPTQDGSARAERIEIVSAEANQGPAAAGTPDSGGFEVPLELTAAWKTADELGEASPPPETTAPAAWRAYLDTLLRWEQLVRAGGDTGRIQGKAAELERELRQKPYLSAPLCVGNSLSVGPVLGLAPYNVGEGRFSDIWNASDAKNRSDCLAKIKDDAVKAGVLDVLVPVRLGIADKVAKKLASDNGPTPENLGRALELLSVVDGSQDKPIETHFALMLERYLDKDRRPDPSLLAAAIRLRLKAEQVAWLAGGGDQGYSYADQVWPWIDKSVVTADRERRLGEDLLFAIDQPSWDAADKHLKKADGIYDQCKQDAQFVSAGLRCRDLVLSRLPYYARWIAGYPGPLPEREVKPLELVETMAAKVHELAELLDADIPDDLKTRLNKIKELTGDLETDYKKLLRLFEPESSRTTYERLASTWHSVDNALSVPFIRADRRMKMLIGLRNVSGQLLKLGEAQSSPTKTAAVNAREMAQRQGRMALAMLGFAWVGDPDARRRLPQGADSLSFDAIAGRITQPSAAWWESIQEAGEAIGRHYRVMAPVITSDLNDAAQATLDKVPKRVARAARLARLLDSATPLGASLTPIGEQRRYWMHELFLWQARRTAADSWRTPGSNSQPYCEEAGERYAQFAEKLIDDDKALSETRKRRLKDVILTRELLKAPLVRFDVPDKMPLVEDRRGRIDCRIAASGDLGIPILIIDPPAAPLSLADPKTPSRKPIFNFVDGSKPDDIPIDFAISGQSADQAAGDAKVALLYRGRRDEKVTHFTFTNQPNLEWVFTPPEGKACFAIAGRRSLQQGAIAIIIDRTPSMDEEIEYLNGKGNREKTGKTKLQMVKESIKNVLGRLPAGTTLTLGTFCGINNQVRFDSLTEHPIQWGQLQGVAPSVIYDRIDRIHTPTRADVPQGGTADTPLAKMVTEVIHGDHGEVLPKDFPGFRGMIVLTDGDDNVSADPGPMVAKVLNSRGAEDISFHMILFGSSIRDKDKPDKQSDIEKAKEQFKKDIESPSNITPGKVWVSVEGANINLEQDLSAALRELMLPKVQIVRGETNGQPEKDRLPISLPGEGAWRVSPMLEAGIYDLRALGIKKKIELEPGDRVLLEMRFDEGKLDLHIPLYADILRDIPHVAHIPRANSSDGKVHLTMTENCLNVRGANNDLQMVTTLERKTQGRLERLKVERPPFAWFEVVPQDAADTKRPAFVRIANKNGLVAPAWDIEVRPWSATRGKTSVRDDPALPRLDAWWVHSFPADSPTVIINQLRDLDQEFKPKKLRVPGCNVDLDEISVKDGVLRVRARYEPDKRIVTRVTFKRDEHRLQLAERHRWYDSANTYIATFGKIEPADLDRQMTFEFYTLQSLKEGNVSNARLDNEKPARNTDERDLLKYLRLKDK